MQRPAILTVSNRTATALVDPRALYHLDQSVPWSLVDASGKPVCIGVAKTAVIFLDGLQPATDYVLHIRATALPFSTAPCAGLVEATDFGVSAAADDNQAALTRAIAAVPAGGTLRLGPGRFVTRPVFLKPNMTLLLDAGATLAATGDRKDWPKLPPHDPEGRVLGTWEGLPEPSFAAVVTAVECDNLGITGRGTIDGGGDRGDWWDWPKETRDGARRPRTLHLAYCQNATVSGITVHNSPSWTVHPYRCDGLHISAITVENPKDSPNTDGLNPESCIGVTITGVSFSVGDDCIAIKAGKRKVGDNSHLAPCEDITIRHCHMQFGHGAVVLGSEMSGSIRRVTVANCTFTQTDRGLRLKTRRGRGGEIADVVLRDVKMDAVPTPFAANAYYFCDPDGKDDWVQTRTPAPVDDTTPRIHNIRLENISAENVSLAAAALLGLPEAPITDVTIRDFTVTYDTAATPDVPLMALGVTPVCHGGVLTEFASVTGDVATPAMKETAAT